MMIIYASGKEVFVDDEDYEYLSQYTWYYSSSGYIVRNLKPGVNPKRIGMHREIMNCPSGFEVDHINHNPLDNRKQNLRVVTRSQNNMNKTRQSNNTSGYLGVSWSKKRKKWRSTITKDGKDYNLGFYNNILDAAMAYDEKARELGFYSRNFPDTL